ncbi:MAG TPA: NUDIX hydrolase [Candidatus Paceibacterota bacterium]|jgi:ADP-ribose pyrophosphatase YjhB (NUDIX family)|nr:NUDIX hydrolase [Candidatus Paceibacterota bacterium]
MEIKSILTDSRGQIINVLYKDVESELDFQEKKISGVHVLCFCKDKLVIVYSESKGYWGPPGGGVEKGESVRDAVRREIKEETNMKVIKQRFIGMQDRFEPKRTVSQARSVCIAEPYGEFTHDPDGGEVTEIKLIDPKDYKKYFDWGIVGDRLMERALETKAQMELELNYTT